MPYDEPLLRACELQFKYIVPYTPTTKLYHNEKIIILPTFQLHHVDVWFSLFLWWKHVKTVCRQFLCESEVLGQGEGAVQALFWKMQASEKQFPYINFLWARRAGIFKVICL